MNSKQVLDIFKTITTIPRESGHEELITKWLLDWAASKGLDAKRDETGNVLIVRKAAKGKENIPTIVLQAHQDIVCEKNAGVTHDFRKDPINYVVEDGWMIAKDTTLGADDGIGIAAALALLEDKTPTGCIECLFTISEETGMDGAEALKPGFFNGKTLVNLDSEDEGQLFIGCAGGLNTNIRFRYDTERVEHPCLKLCISGGIGGHSGDDINKERANAVQLMVRFLYGEFNRGLQLVNICGGGKPNAIARECEAIVAIENGKAMSRRFAAYAKAVKAEYHTSDPGLVFSCEPVRRSVKAVSSDIAEIVVRSMFTCPHGVQAMSQDIPGLVETSTNLASVNMKRRGVIEIVTSQRSSVTSERRMIAAKVRANFEAAGAIVRHLYEYPGWTPDVNSHILKVCVDSYRKLFKEEPEVKAIHAGLECGLFLTKFPGLDMISFGPTLRGVHAPGERMELSSLDRFVELLEDVVVNFK